MTKDKTDAAPKPKGKLKKLLFIGVGALVLIGAGAGAGIYFGALSAHEAKPEDHYPKLVVRSSNDALASTASVVGAAGGFTALTDFSRTLTGSPGS